MNTLASSTARNLRVLQMLQALPLRVKIEKTKLRIREWVERYGEDGVYISFSGGKDSTVLLHIARQMYPNLKAVFVDTGLEYPEIRAFVKTFDNVDWLKPKMNFRQVIEKYGYPFISKEVSECVDGARKYLKSLTDRQTDRQTPYRYWYERVTGTGAYQQHQHRNTSQVPIRNEQTSWNLPIIQQFKKNLGGGYDNKYRKLRGLEEYRNTRECKTKNDDGDIP